MTSGRGICKPEDLLKSIILKRVLFPNQRLVLAND